MVVEEKKIIRRRMLLERSSLNNKVRGQYDDLLVASLIELCRTHAWKTVHSFIPMADEINILPFISFLLNSRIKVVVPKVLPNRQMLNLELDRLDKLEKGVFGTRYPKSNTVYLESYDAVIVPGLAFDETFNRLGYGGGYYDSFLRGDNQRVSFGVFYPFQEVKSLPKTPFDVSLNTIVLPSGTRSRKPL